MRTILMGLLLTALCAIAPVRAHAQAAQPQTQDEAAAMAQLRTSMSASAHASFAAMVKEARERGLPTQPLIAKAQEGAAKKIPGDRIVLAARASFDRLTRAQVLLRAGGGTATADDISVVAEALLRGVPEDAITKLIADPRGRATIALSAHALADMLGHGVPLAVGVEVIGAWRVQGADPAKLKEIPAAVERLVRQGVVPARAGAAVAAGIRLGRSPLSITPVEVPRILRGG